jgi:hypothetical protein
MKLWTIDALPETIKLIMKAIQHKTNVIGNECTLELMSFSESDKKQWKELYDLWNKLRLGMKDYGSRSPNFPEGLSEVAFCLYTGSKRFISLKGKSSASFDTFNIETNRAEQIKASSVGKDTTSFGPKSEWDDLYFLDFYNEGKYDGTFNVYKISSEMIYSVKVNKNQSLTDQQAEGKRPRFSIINKFIKTGKVRPLATNVRVW